MGLYKLSGLKHIQHYGYAVIAGLASLLNYIVYPLLARIITPQQLGDITTLFSTNTQLAGIFTALNVVSIYVVKTNGPRDAKDILESVQKVIIYLSLILIAIVIVASPLLRQLFSIQFAWGFVLIGVLLIANIPVTIWIGYLQGHNKLVKAALVSLIISLLQLVLALPLAMAYGDAGAVWGYVLGLMGGIVIIRVAMNRQLPRLHGLTRFGADDKSRIDNIIKYVLWSVFVMLILWLIQSVDILYTKAIFSTQDAGIYSGISIFGRAEYFLGFVLIWLILPSVRPGAHKNNQRLFLGGIGALMLLGLASVLAVAILDNLLINLFLGNAYIEQKNLLVNSVLFKSILLAVTFVIIYFMVLRNKLSILFTVFLSLGVGFACLQRYTTIADFLSRLVVATLVGVGIAAVSAVLINWKVLRDVRAS